MEVLLRYVTVATDTVGPADLERAVTEALGAKGDEIMPTIAQKWIEQGMEKGLQRGLQQGLQQGLEEGQLKVAREDVIDALEARFGTVSGEVVDRIQGVTDLAKLKLLHRQAVRAETLEAFRRAMEIVLG